MMFRNRRSAKSGRLLRFKVLSGWPSSVSAMQKKQRPGDDAHRPGNDLPRQLFMQEQNAEDDHQRHAQFINRSDLGNIAALQRLEVEQP